MTNASEPPAPAHSPGVRPIDPQADARNLLALYERYAAELRNFGPAGFDRENPWWNRPDQCSTIVAATPDGLVGFLMVGSGEQVDRDVRSEICEAYVAPTWRGRGVLPRMFNAAVPMLHHPWGFQILASNVRMWKCVEHLLRRQAMRYTVREATDDAAPMRRYRIVK